MDKQKETSTGLLRSTGGALLTGAGKLGKLILPKLKKMAKRIVKRRYAKRCNRLLRRTALLSGFVMVGSIAALIFLNKKD